MEGLPVTIRTVDVGADKPLDGLSPTSCGASILNPALGLRAIRWSLSEPAMFRSSCAPSCAPLRTARSDLLIPMVAHASEIRQRSLPLIGPGTAGPPQAKPMQPIEVGAMIEVPAAALMLPTFLRHFDFVSIGTNDLIQYTLAIDRADEAVSHLYDPWHPAVLRLVAETIAECDAHGKGVSVCGEMAGDPAFTELLLAHGPAQLLDASGADVDREAAHLARRHPSARATAARRCSRARILKRRAHGCLLLRPGARCLGPPSSYSGRFRSALKSSPCVGCTLRSDPATD